MMDVFLVNLDESIRRKVWERKNLPMTMMKLLDLVVCLDEVGEVGQN